MSEIEELKVGKRGKIYTTQKIRMKTGLTPGGKTPLEKPRTNPKPLSPKELSRLRKELAEEIETRQ